MERADLEQRKEKLIEWLKSYCPFKEENEVMKKLVLKLLKGTEITDADFSQVLEDGMGESIIELFLDCYDLKQFVEWLNDNDFNLFINYRYANTISVVEALEEIDRTQVAPSYCYDFDIEEYSLLKNDEERKTYIREHFDGLIYNDEVLVISW